MITPEPLALGCCRLSPKKPNTRCWGMVLTTVTTAGPTRLTAATTALFVLSAAIDDAADMAGTTFGVAAIGVV